MIRVEIPENYHSIERLTLWMQDHFPFDNKQEPRWIVRDGEPEWDWCIYFRDEPDVSMFHLLR
jgi:hypothetical protein